MGSGIAQVAAAAGYPTTVREIGDDVLKKGMTLIEKSLTKLVERGNITAEKKSDTLDRLAGTTRFEDLADCDIVIEAITENLAAKRDIYSVLDKVAKPNAIFASNTSSLVVTEMMTATKRVDRFIGMHFFNPVPLMKLVEVVSTIATDPAVIDEAMEFTTSMGKCRSGRGTAPDSLSTVC
jgi:3-hydroxybutyryl-CoA dehydrogenase